MSKEIITTKSPPGFRISLVDGFVIGACIIFTVWALVNAIPQYLALLPAVVFFHFFLFCNVFRVRRKYELIWAGFFIVFYASIFLLAPTGLFWILVFPLQTPVTLTVVALTVFSTDYHGIGYSLKR